MKGTYPFLGKKKYPAKKPDSKEIYIIRGYEKE
jgi:hypothetical protein